MSTSLKTPLNEYHYAPLKDAGLADWQQLPFTLKILLENTLRHANHPAAHPDDVDAFARWLKDPSYQQDINYFPARVLMQDFTGVPAVVDLAAMRDAMMAMGGNPKDINPLTPVDLVIDHSVQVDHFGHANAFLQNVSTEMERNRERYEFLRWGQKAFSNFRVVPPGTGICHQVNLEYLAQTVWQQTKDGVTWAYPDTLVGTDSHTTMVNGLGVLGWGVGGIEAEAAILGQPISMRLPQVVGFELKGTLQEGLTATDLVLTITERLRAHGVVGKFVEFFGDGVAQLSLADRATIANMAPEYGATCGFFPVDAETLNFLRLTGRSEETLALVEAYTQAQGLWRDPGMPAPVFTETLSLDLNDIEPSLAGPKRPQDRVALKALPTLAKTLCEKDTVDTNTLTDGSVVIAAITSCTNTSNPGVMLAAGLLAQKAHEKGLACKPWVKTSLAPGSKVVTAYLKAAGLTHALDALGFHLVGYGCTTCIGNSGPLPEDIQNAIDTKDLFVCSVLSGNRNFEGRVHPSTRANWLASPPLVVAYALAGNMMVDLQNDPLGHDAEGTPVYLKDIWPSQQEIQTALSALKRDLFEKEYAGVFEGDADWQAIPAPEGTTYQWSGESTYVQHPPFFEGLSQTLPVIEDIQDAHILALLGDSVTTDHISPAGVIKADSPAGLYLKKNGVAPKDFNSYGARRGNHEVMMRGTFANIRIRNAMVPDIEGGYTQHIPSQETLSIYDAAMRYQADSTPLVVFAGKEYGTGSSRDWAAKGTRLLGVKAVIAQSFERIHRSNLIGMGVLPLQLPEGTSWESLGLTGQETVSLQGLADLTPAGTLTLTCGEHTLSVLCRIDTQTEWVYYQNGGILQTVLRQRQKARA